MPQRVILVSMLLFAAMRASRWLLSIVAFWIFTFKFGW